MVSLFISRLQARPRQNALARALQEYGRVVKTNFILRYLLSEQYRRRINTQLNKGESLHALQLFLFFRQSGIASAPSTKGSSESGFVPDPGDHAVMTWNMVYISVAITNLRAQGHVVADSDLVHLSPALYAHINRYGKYHFEATSSQDQPPRCPLRQPSVLKA